MCPRDDAAPQFVMDVKFNISALSLGSSTSRIANALQRSFERAASSGIESSQDEVSLAIQNVNAQMRGLSGVSLSLNRAFGVTQTLDFSLSRMDEILNELKEISSSASRVSPASLETINSRINSLTSEFSQIQETSRFENLFLLNGSTKQLNILLNPLSGESLSYELPGLELGNLGNIQATQVSSLGYYGETRIVGDNNGSFTLDAFYTSGSGSLDNIEAPDFVTVGAGSFADSLSPDFDFGDGSYRPLDYADFDGDGNIDIFLQGISPGARNYGAIALGNGDGTFAAVSASFDNFTNAIVEDLDNDGDLDIFTSNALTGSLTYFNDGSGSMSLGTTFDDVGSNFSFADVDNDGDADLVGAQNGALEVRLNDGSGSFAAETTYAYTTGVSATQPLFADFNNDGDLDVIAGSISGEATYFEGNGDGTFNAGVSLGPGSPAAIADLDGDGNLDLVKNGDFFTVTGTIVQLGNGDGTFQAVVTLGSGTQYSGITLADLDADGALDIIASTSGSGTEVFLNDGAGTFTSSETLAAFNSVVEVFDYDGDGDLDLLDTRGPAFEVRLNDGDGTFSQGVTLEDSGNPYGGLVDFVDLNGDGVRDFISFNSAVENNQISLANTQLKVFAGGNALEGAQDLNIHSDDGFAVGDLNGDGIDDLVTGDSTAMRIHLGRGDGSFYSGGTFVDAALGLIEDISLIDLDNDGDLDLLGVDDLQNSIIYLNDGDASFTFSEVLNPSNTSGFQTTGDFDGDGFVDILSYDEGGGNDYYGIYFNDGDGTFTLSTTIADSFDIEGLLGVADLNGDGRDDFIAGDQLAGTLSIYTSLGDGSFDQTSTLSSVGLPNSLSFGDIDSDGDVDILVTNGPSSSSYTNNGSGVFSLFSTFATSTSSRGQLLDYDGDGDLDFFAIDAFTSELQFFEGDGDGNFSASFTETLAGLVSDVTFRDTDGDGALNIIFGSNGRLRSSEFVSSEVSSLNPTGEGADQTVLLQDLNGDGRDDLISVNTYENSVSVRLGNGDGTFDSETTFAVGVGPQEIQAADVNNDGEIDLLVTNKDSGTVSILEGLGDGSFSAQSTVFVGNKPVGLVATDFDGDGNIDFATANKNDGTLAIFSGDGAGNFSQTSTITLNAGVYDLSLAAFDGNEAHDLVAINRETSEVSLFKNNGDGTFTQAATLYGGTTPSSILVADINGDTYEDIIIGDEGLGEIRVFLGNGDASFDAAMTYSVDGDPTSLLLVDTDGDEIDDLVVGVDNPAADYLSVFKGVGDGSFQSATTIDVAGNASIVSGDIDGDLDEDIILNLRDSDQIGVLLGEGGGNVVEPSTYVTELQTDYESFLETVEDALVNVEEARQSVSQFHSRLELLYGEQVGQISGGVQFLREQVLPAALQTELSGQEILELTSYVAQEIRQQGSRASQLYQPIELQRISQLLEALL